MSAPWWHPIPTPASEVEPDDDGLVVCPHCKQEGCARCLWAGVITQPEGETA